MGTVGDADAADSDGKRRGSFIAESSSGLPFALSFVVVGCVYSFDVLLSSLSVVVAVLFSFVVVADECGVFLSFF